MEDKLEKKIRSKQAQMIKESNKAISFSFVVNQLLEAAIKQ